MKSSEAQNLSPPRLTHLVEQGSGFCISGLLAHRPKRAEH
jgi:hypothetical protein